MQTRDNKCVFRIWTRNSGSSSDDSFLSGLVAWESTERLLVSSEALWITGPWISLSLSPEGAMSALTARGYVVTKPTDADKSLFETSLLGQHCIHQSRLYFQNSDSLR